MSEEKVLFKCTLTSSAKDLNEAAICAKKKFFNTIKTMWILFTTLLVMFYIGDLIYTQDRYLTEAIITFLSDKRLILIIILCTLGIWNITNIMSWVIIRIAHIKRKNIEKPPFYINFYETFYEAPIFNRKTRAYSQVRINYTDISRFDTTENLYVFYMYKSKKLTLLPFIRKDSFIIGEEQEFIEFIKPRIQRIQ